MYMHSLVYTCTAHFIMWPLLGYHSDTHTTLLVSLPSCVQFLSVGFIHNDMITMKTTDSTRNAKNRTTLSPIPGISDDIMHTQTRMCLAVVGVGLNYKLLHGICSPRRLALDLVSLWEYIDSLTLVTM